MKICMCCMKQMKNGDQIISVVWNRDDHGRRKGKLIDVHLRCFDWKMLERRNVKVIVEFPGELYDLGVLVIRKYRGYGTYDAYGNKVKRTKQSIEENNIVLDPQDMLGW